MASSEHAVQVNGLRFHCRVDGPIDAPWMIFSNSLMTNLTLWDEQVRVFDDRYRILRYDQRGHGRTEVPPSPCTVDELTDDLLGLCDSFMIPSAVVVGVSMGGVTALRMAQRHGRRVAGVVACDCQWFSPPSSVVVWDERIRIAREEGMSGLVGSTLARWFRPGLVAKGSPALDRVREMIERTPVDGFVACARALQSFDIRPDFLRNVARTLFLVGDGDGVLPTVMREMHHALRGSAFVQIAEAGHLPHLEQPASVTRVLEEFLACHD